MMKKQLTAILLTLALALSLCACAPTQPVETDTTTKFTNEGFTLSVPNEYVDLLIVDTNITPSEWNRSNLFDVSEKASVEAANQLWPDDETAGGGSLFGIGVVDEATFHDMMIWGMNGADVFARDDKGNYYIYYHPTDVQLIRAYDPCTDADWEQWGELCEWANNMKVTFLADNPGLTAYERTYSMLDCALHYVAYGEGSAHLHYKHGDAVYTPQRTDSMPYLEQLLDDVMYFNLLRDDEFDPEGDYITLSAHETFNFLSFDFFTDEGQQHIIRLRRNDMDVDPTYCVASKDGAYSSVGKVVANWLDALS